MDDRNTLDAVNAIIQKKRQQTERELNEDHDSCLVLKNKLEYLVKSPTREITQIKNIGKYADILRDRRYVYYTGCDELKSFVNGRRDSTISFTVGNHYVNYVSDPHVVGDNKLNYALFGAD